MTDPEDAAEAGNSFLAYLYGAKVESPPASTPDRVQSVTDRSPTEFFTPDRVDTVTDRSPTEFFTPDRVDAVTDRSPTASPEKTDGSSATSSTVPEPPGIDVAEAVRDALADVIAVPITNLVMVNLRSLGDGGKNGAAGERIDTTSEGLQAIVDPARIPSVLVEKAVTHLIAPIAAATFGPIGPVIAIFAGNFAGELTHQALDADRNVTGIQRAEGAIQLTGAFANARIGRLAESESFRDYVSGVTGRQIAAIIGHDSGAATGLNGERVTGRPPAITAVVAAYEVDIPGSRSRSTLSADSTTVRIRPASFAVLECIPGEAVFRQWRSGSHEFLRLTDGTVFKRRIGGARPDRWARVSG
jgi:hypothetical protein